MATLALAGLMSMPAFAGQWEFVKEVNLWIYKDDKGVEVSDQWVGNYYLDSRGFMLTDSVTPDGYYVGSDGLWDGQPKGQSSKLQGGVANYASLLKSYKYSWAELAFVPSGVLDVGDYYAVPGQIIGCEDSGDSLDSEWHYLYSGMIYVSKKAKFKTYMGDKYVNVSFTEAMNYTIAQDTTGTQRCQFTVQDFDSHGIAQSGYASWAN